MMIQIKRHADHQFLKKTHLGFLGKIGLQQRPREFQDRLVISRCVLFVADNDLQLLCYFKGKRCRRLCLFLLLILLFLQSLGHILRHLLTVLLQSSL